MTSTVGDTPVGHTTGSATLSRQCRTLARRGTVKLLRTPEALISVTAQPVLFLLMFVYLFGGAVAGSTQRYLQFVVPGVLVQSVLLASIEVGTSLNIDLRAGIFDRLRTLPIARSAPLIGAVLADLLRYLIAVLSTVLFGYLLGFRARAGLLPLIAAGTLVIAFAVCLCWLSVLIGITARSAASVQGSLLVLMFPLTFGSSIFVPIDSLPGWLQPVIAANPVSHLTAVTRALMTGGAVTRHLLWTLGWMAVLLAALFPAALHAYRRRAGN